MIKPTPPIVSGALPLLGHTLEFRKNRFQLLRRGYEEQGAIFGIKLANRKVAVLIGPEYHQVFFEQTDRALHYSKPLAYVKPVFGDVGFLADPQTARRQRPIFLEPFRSTKMPHYVRVMQRVTQAWLDGLGDAGEIELVEVMRRLVQQIAGQAFMGEDFQKRVGREFWDLYLVLRDAMDPFLPPHWPLPKFRRRDRAKARMQAILKPIIDERRQNPDRYSDFMQDFVNKRYDDGSQVEDEVIIGILLGLMFAGHETTAAHVAWTIIQLLQHPGYLSHVHADLQTHLPPRTAFDLQTISQLKHVAWAVRETGRMYPAADMIIRYADEPLEVGDYGIPAGWLVQLAIEVSHLLPHVFQAPDRYDPLRYAPGRAEDKQHPHALIGFGGGTHRCTGMHFANNEMLAITSLLFQQFELELVTQDPVVVRDATTTNRPSATVVRYRRR